MSDGGRKTVGVMGDKRSYENVASIRIVNSQDGMTADFAKIPKNSEMD